MRGFKSFRNDRSTKGGGILFYVNECISSSVVRQSRCNKTEYLFIELKFNRQKVLFCCIYNSHASNDLYLFLNELNTVSPLYSNIVLTGDFNLDLLNPSKLSFISSALSSSALEIISEPTRYPSAINGTSSLLDYFAVSDLMKVSTNWMFKSI